MLSLSLRLLRTRIELYERPLLPSNVLIQICLIVLKSLRNHYKIHCCKKSANFAKKSGTIYFDNNIWRRLFHDFRWYNVNPNIRVIFTSPCCTNLTTLIFYENGVMMYNSQVIRRNFPPAKVRTRRPLICSLPLDWIIWRTWRVVAS